jgi:hypothetical protein
VDLSGAGDALPEGVTASTVQTPRLATHLLESGPESAVPVVFVHGNVLPDRAEDPPRLL